MQETTINLTGQITLSYDEESKEFKEALAAFSDLIDRSGGKEGMLIHIAHNLAHFGIDSMVEGVGYIGLDGKRPSDEPFSGIYVDRNYDDFDYEIER